MFWSIVRWLIGAAVMVAIFLIMQSYPTIAALSVCLLSALNGRSIDQIKSLESRLRQKDDEIKHMCARFDKKQRELELRIERLTD